MKIFTLYSVDLLHYVCQIALLTIFRWIWAAGTSLGGRMLVSPAVMHGLPNFNGNGPHYLLWAGSLAARGKITGSGTPDRLNYSVFYSVYAIYKCGRGRHITWRNAGWRPM